MTAHNTSKKLARDLGVEDMWREFPEAMAAFDVHCTHLHQLDVHWHYRPHGGYRNGTAVADDGKIGNLYAIAHDPTPGTVSPRRSSIARATWPSIISRWDFMAGVWIRSTHGVPSYPRRDARPYPVAGVPL